MSDVAACLKSVRERKRLSQRGLARRAGILDSIDVSLAEFFSFELPPEANIFFRAEDLLEIGSGGVSYRQVGTFNSDRRLQILVETNEPGADSGRVMLQHEGEEGGVVVYGRFEVTVGGQTRVLGPGDAYLFHTTPPLVSATLTRRPAG